MKEAKLEGEVPAKGGKPRPTPAAGALASVSSWPSQTKSFLGDVRSEAKRVTWPSLAQIRGTTLVVIVTVFFFGVYFGILDWVFNNVIRRLLRLGS